MTIHENSEQELRAHRKLLTMLVLGFVILTTGLVLVTVATTLTQSGQASFASIIFIGPFPIIFGAGLEAQWLVLVAMILTVLMLIILLILRKKPPEKSA